MPASGSSTTPPERPPRPRKRLGQHFLSDPRILSRIVDALDPGPGETVVEVGPGRGALTDLLRERSGRVIAVELDRVLAQRLRERYVDDPRVRIVEGDVLDLSLGALAGGPYALVGNVPYYITTPIVFHALEAPRPTRAVFLVQREVAERMTAGPGGREYGALTVNLGALARVEMLFRVPAGAFQPPPRVESAVVRITPLEEPPVAPGEEARFRTLVQAVFALRRKQMGRVLRSVAGLDQEHAARLLAELGIDPAARPETLDAASFVRLARRLPQGVPR